MTNQASKRNDLYLGIILLIVGIALSGLSRDKLEGLLEFFTTGASYLISVWGFLEIRDYIKSGKSDDK